MARQKKTPPRAVGGEGGISGGIAVNEVVGCAQDSTERTALLSSYLEAGLALVPIPLGSKGPTAKGWNLRENAIRTEDGAARLNGQCNIGLAHAYCEPSPTCAIDLDNISMARPWFAERGVDIEALLDAPDAVRIESGRLGRSKLLYRAPRALPTHKIGEGGVEFRCASREGLTVQDVLPPSVHPDTGLPYRLIGDIGNIPPLPDALLSIWHGLGTAFTTPRLEKVKADDPLLQTMVTLGMVKADGGHGKFLIECPFAEHHTMNGGEGETAYWLPHTGGYAMAHFKCLHAGCAERTDTEFITAVLARHQRAQGGPAPFALDIPLPAPALEPRLPDTELEWLVDNAPAVMRDYIGWYQRNALRPHRVFALASGLLFVQAVAGRRFALRRGLRLNLWTLLLAPTESGKGDVSRLAGRALDQLSASKIMPAIPPFEQAFGSAEAMWWHLQAFPQAILFDEELAKTLAAIIAAPEGSPRYHMRRTLLVLHDAADKAFVPPIRYSRRTKSAREMLPLSYPFFSVCGTGVPRDISKFSAAAADDGLLNRFLPIVVEDMPTVGRLTDLTVLPDGILEWARRLCPTNAAVELFAQAGDVTVLENYDGMDADWAMEMTFGTRRAQELPGIWGRYAEKVLQISMLCAVADNGSITSETFAWARRLVRWALADFAKRFEQEGGGAENELDGMAKAFMATFEANSMKGRDIIPSREFARFGGRAWRDCKDSLKRKRVVETLLQDGAIEEMPLQPKGVGYRRLKTG